MVRTTDGYLVEWNKARIVDQLVRETELAETMFGIPPLSPLKAEKLSQEVERRIKLIKPKVVSGPMVREITNNVLLEWSESENMPELQVYRNILTRVGVPVVDAYEIDTGSGFEAKENANLQPNPETVHKKKADRLSKEQYLLLMDPTLATAHHQGDIHIHTLEYFGSSSVLSGLGPALLPLLWFHPRWLGLQEQCGWSSEAAGGRHPSQREGVGGGADELQRRAGLHVLHDVPRALPQGSAV